jgi:hypothetical protein
MMWAAGATRIIQDPPTRKVYAAAFGDHELKRQQTASIMT